LRDESVLRSSRSSSGVLGAPEELLCSLGIKAVVCKLKEDYQQCFTGREGLRCNGPYKLDSSSQALVGSPLSVFPSPGLLTLDWSEIAERRMHTLGPIDIVDDLADWRERLGEVAVLR
jgi:hypothetical protein